MIEQVRLLDWLLEVDKDATRAVYKHLPEIACTCTNCRNYKAAIKLLPSDFLDACHTLAIDPLKAAEIWEVTDVDGTHFYAGWYHLVGTILEGTSSVLQTDPQGLLPKEFRISFTQQVELVPENFPAPVLQMDFTGKVPWVLAQSPNSLDY